MNEYKIADINAVCLQAWFAWAILIGWSVCIAALVWTMYENRVLRRSIDELIEED